MSFTFSLRILSDNTTSVLSLFVGNSNVHPTLIIRMHGKGQHYSLHALVCNILTFFIQSCMFFFFNVRFERKSIFAVVVIGSLSALRVACMQLFSHHNLQQFILMWVYRFQEFSSGCIRDSRHCRRYFVSHSLYVNQIHL